eukprot:6196469-Pleurochrysis_carterae.AAC.2
MLAEECKYAWPAEPQTIQGTALAWLCNPNIAFNIQKETLTVGASTVSLNVHQPTAPTIIYASNAISKMHARSFASDQSVHS